MPVAIAAFTTIVNPALLICHHMHKGPLILAILHVYKLKRKIQIFKERCYSAKKVWERVPTPLHPG